MRNPLQEQLLKAGLVKKGKVAQVVREQTRQKQGKTPAPADNTQIDAQRLLAERAARDRALAAERNALARAAEVQAQIRQIIDSHKLKRTGEIAYSFTDEGRIQSIWVDESQRTQLAKGGVVIVRRAASYELLPRAAAEKIYARDESAVVLDHGRHTDGGSGSGSGSGSDDDEYYRRFEVPDDLIW